MASPPPTMHNPLARAAPVPRGYPLHPPLPVPNRPPIQDWAPGPIHPSPTKAIIRGHEAKTTRERVVYQRRCVVQLTTMEDVMAVLGWAVVLPVCELPNRDLPSNTRLHRLLVSLMDI